MIVSLAPAAKSAMAPPILRECMANSSGNSPIADMRPLIVELMVSYAKGRFVAGSLKRGVVVSN